MKKFVSLAVSALLVLAISAPAAVAGASGTGASERIKRGHYEGKSSSGLAISFDVVGKRGKTRVANLAADVRTECWNDLDRDGASDTIVAHVSGLSGKVSRSGDVEVYFAPDDDTEYIVEGNIEKGLARLNVIVGGWWDLAGMPNFAGPLQCDNWGARYKAARRR